MSQVSKANLKHSRSYTDNSIKFGSPIREPTVRFEEHKSDDRRYEERKFGNTRFEGTKIEERKSNAGPKTYVQEYDNDNSFSGISDIRPTPQPKKDLSRRTLDPPIEMAPVQPISKEKKKRVKKVKKKSRSRSPNEAKKMINYSVINKNIH